MKALLVLSLATLRVTFVRSKVGKIIAVVWKLHQATSGGPGSQNGFNTRAAGGDFKTKLINLATSAPMSKTCFTAQYHVNGDINSM